MAVSKPRYSLTLTKNVRKDVTRAIPLVASFEEPGKSVRTSAPRVGRKTRVVRRSDPSGWKFAKLIASSYPHVDDQHGDAQRERERVVADGGEDERFDALVHVPLVRDEAAEGTGLLVEGMRLRRDGLRRPVGFAVPAPCPGEARHGDAEGEKHETDLEPVRHLVDLRVRDGSFEETPDPIRAAEGRGDADEAGDDGERSEEHTSELQSLRHLV